MRKLLVPYVTGLGRLDEAGCERAALHELYPKLKLYLDLLLRWNERTNLTAIREPGRIVQRHFGESLFAGFYLARKVGERGDAA